MAYRLAGIVSVDKRGQPLDGLGLVAADRFGRSIEAEQRDIGRRRIVRLEHRRRLRPNPVRHIRMHDPTVPYGVAMVIARGMAASASPHLR